MARRLAGRGDAAAVLYAVAPYHFRHQSFLFACYTVPMAAYLVLAVYLEAPLFERRTATARGSLRYASRRSLLTLALCVVVGLSGIYYVAFAAILVAAAGALRFVVSRRKAALLRSAVVVAALVATPALAALPDLLYRAEHGRNPVVGVRGAEESQIYSLNLTQLLMPVPGHRLEPARSLRERWMASSPVDKEPTHLGLVAGVGFVWLLALAVAACAGAAGRLTGDPRLRSLAAAVVTALVVGTTGGLSVLFAYTVSAQLRTWTRLTIFIAFFSLAAVGLLLDRAGHKLGRRSARARRVLAGALAAILVIGVLDQTSPSFIPPYSQTAATYASDAAFVQQIERSVPRGAMIFQLPYVPFPESDPVERMVDYDLLRPYLHSRELRWSYGAMKGRPEDWQAELDSAPPAELLPALSAAGFAGVYVDRFGYADNAAELERGLARILGAGPVTSSDRRLTFFDMAAYNRELRRPRSPAELRALADATLSPLRTDWRDAFSNREPEGSESARWAVDPRATLPVFNPSQRERRATLVVRLARPGGPPAPVELTYPSGAAERVRATPSGTTVRRALRFAPGQSWIQISTEGFPVEALSSAGPVRGFVKLTGFRLTPDPAGDYPRARDG